MLTLKQCLHVYTWVMNNFKLKVKADINSKTMLACVYIGEEQLFLDLGSD